MSGKEIRNWRKTRIATRKLGHLRHKFFDRIRKMEQAQKLAKVLAGENGH